MKNNDLLSPPPVRLTEDAAASLDPSKAESLKAHPESPLLWAARAEKALELADGDEANITAYALARTGYHRGLDRLRSQGWKGFGPVPFSHEPNQGVLRAIAALARAARRIGETKEFERCQEMLADADPEAVKELLGSEDEN